MRGYPDGRGAIAPSKGPNTDEQDQLSPDLQIRLATHGRSIQMCHFLTHALQQTIYTGWNASLTPRKIVNVFGGAGTGPGNSYVSNQAPVATNARVAHVIGRRAPCANAFRAR